MVEHKTTVSNLCYEFALYTLRCTMVNDSVLALLIRTWQTETNSAGVKTRFLFLQYCIGFCCINCEGLEQANSHHSVYPSMSSYIKFSGDLRKTLTCSCSIFHDIHNMDSCF